MTFFEFAAGVARAHAGLVTGQTKAQQDAMRRRWDAKRAEPDEEDEEGVEEKKSASPSAKPFQIERAGGAPDEKDKENKRARWLAEHYEPREEK